MPHGRTAAPGNRCGHPHRPLERAAPPRSDPDIAKRYAPLIPHIIKNRIQQHFLALNLNKKEDSKAIPVHPLIPKIMRPLFYPVPSILRAAWTLIATFIVVIGLHSPLHAAVYPADIALLSLETIGNDRITFLVLQPIPAGEQLKFTDRGWRIPEQAFRAGESTVTWTAPYTIYPGNTVTVNLGNTIDPGGDQVLIYQGSDANPNFIAAIQVHPDLAWQTTATDIHTSALPPGLYDGFTALAAPYGAQVAYDCANNTGNQVELLVTLHTSTNWLASNASSWNLPNCSFNPPYYSATAIIGSVADVNEADGTVIVPVYSSHSGNHSVQVTTCSSTATPGANGDFSFLGSSTVNFSSGQVQYVTLQLRNDNLCEGIENICLGLSNAWGCIASNANYAFNLWDDDASTVVNLQTFENGPQDTWSYTTSPSPYNTQSSPDPLIIRGQEHVWQRIQSFQGSFGPAAGQHFWGFSDFYGSTPHDIEFATLPVAGIEHASLIFKYITFNFGSGDEIEYWVSYNGSGNWNNATVVPLSGNTQAWRTVVVPVPQGAQSVRLRIRARQVNGVVCGGIDDVCLVSSDCQPPSITVSSLPTSICAGAGSLSVPFTTTGSFAAGNTFTAQLSDATGSFAGPIALGSLALSGSAPFGTIQGVLPIGLPAGTAYRVRVVSNSPALASPDNGVNIRISQLALSLSATNFANGFQISCPGLQDGSLGASISQGQAPFSYLWTGPGGFSSTATQLQNLGAGTYTLTLSDASGCTLTASTTLLAPTLNLAVSATPISCFGAADGGLQATFSGSNGPFSLQWSGPGGFAATGAQLSALAPGLYQVTLTDASGCTATQQATVNEPASLQLTVAAPVQGCGTNISCATAPDGRLNLTLQGGTLPYSYQWTGPGGFQSSSANLQNLGPGSYALTVTDARGCQVFASQNLTAPAPLAATINSPLNACGHAVSCFGGMDGSVEIGGFSGGCPPYTVGWSNGGSGLLQTGLAAGTYVATVTDAVGCRITRSITLTQPGPLSLNPTITPATCSLSPDGAIDLNVAGGCPGYTYMWSGPRNFQSSAEDIQAVRSGTYHVTVTDAMGCTRSDSIVVGTLDNLSATLGCCQDTAICYGDSVLLRVDLTGTGPWFLSYTIGTVPRTDLVLASPYYISAHADKTTIYTLTGLVQGATDCPGRICGSATVAVNNCDTTGCADLCVNTGVLSQELEGNCRTVTLEVACDTACNNKTALQTGGACLSFRSLDFDRLPDGSPLSAGSLVQHQWAALGFHISALNNASGHPQQAILFGSDWPTGGDLDLGTPHMDFSGPGVGAGGAAGSPGQNNRVRGNLLVIAEDLNDANGDGLVDDPSDERLGGTLIFDLDAPRYFESVTLVDIDSLNAEVRLLLADGSTRAFDVPALGDNSVTTVLLQTDNVVELRIVFPEEGALADIQYCPARGGSAYFDISVPCGQIQSYRNSAGLPMALIQADTATGITGIRVYGLPGYCLEPDGQGPFTVSYSVCDTSCGSGFCLPMVAYQRDGCTQYEQAVMGSVNTPIPPLARILPIGQAAIAATPNPARGNTEVRFYTLAAARTQVDLIDLSGHVLKQLWQGETLADELYSVALPTSSLPEGMYFLRLRTEAGIQMTSKLLILP
jgi:hypothetical protein